MKKVMTLVLALGLLAGAGSMIWAWSGLEYYVPEIPAGEEPEIDGVLDDPFWVNMPAEYVLTTPDLYDPPWGGEGNSGLDDVDVQYRMGWSAATNMFYAAVQVFDDVHVGDPTKGYWDNDSINFYTDPDHSGGSFGWDEPEETRWSGGCQWWINVDEPSADWGPVGSMNTDPTYAQPPNLVYGWTKSDDGLTYYYEWAAVLWDFQANLAQGGIEQGIKHTLAEEDVLGITISIYDIDPDETPSELSITPEPNTCKIADGMSELILVGPYEVTAVEASTWGRIKSTFDE